MSGPPNDPFPLYLDPFPSYLDPSLHNAPSQPRMPIPPDQFYGTLCFMPGDKSLCPPLCSLTQGLLSGTSSANASHLPSPTNRPGIKTGLKAVGKARKHEEFSIADLNQLLRATIEVNPYSAPRNSIGEAWKEVTQKAQEAGYCLGRNTDTCKKHVASLLAWCEVSPMCHLCFSRTTNTYLLGGQGAEASLCADMPVRGQPGHVCIALRQDRLDCQPQASGKGAI